MARFKRRGLAWEGMLLGIAEVMLRKADDLNRVALAPAHKHMPWRQSHLERALRLSLAAQRITTFAKARVPLKRSPDGLHMILKTEVPRA